LAILLGESNEIGDWEKNINAVFAKYDSLIYAKYFLLKNKFPF